MASSISAETSSSSQMRRRKTNESRGHGLGHAAAEERLEVAGDQPQRNAKLGQRGR